MALMREWAGFLMVGACLSLPAHRVLAAGTGDLALLMSLYGDEETVALATGEAKPLRLSPATASVITAEDIKASGATNVIEALEAVPGLHVGTSAINYQEIFTFRGIFSNTNPQVLVMVNGVPISSLFQGNRHLFWGGMPVADISRIEVLRGPGSAIYGADAFAGVINIITKRADEIQGWQGGVRYGSFDTREIWLQQGTSLSGYDLVFNLEYADTDGHKRIIDSDAQTIFDTIDGTQASHAPGPVSLSQESYDLSLDVTRDDWHLYLRNEHRLKGLGAGVAEALDPTGRYASNRWLLLLENEYHNATDWTINTRLSYRDTTQEIEEDEVVYPAGTGLGLGFGALFPDGFIGNPEVFERTARLGFAASYDGMLGHQWRFGAGFEYFDLYKIRETKNFGPDPSTGCSSGLPLGVPVTDVSDTCAVFLPERSRNNRYVFIQDAWQFLPGWELTAGARYDNYSDFGATVNPRLALVWDSGLHWTTKLLYGSAFRAPSMSELFNQNNPVLVGNPSLKPEKIDTYELGVYYQPSRSLSFSADIFYYRWQDIIQFVPTGVPGQPAPAMNIGTQTGRGIELEAMVMATDDLTLKGNFAYQHSRNSHGDNPGNAPGRQLFLQADWSFMPAWHLNTQANYVMDRVRAPGDSREQMDDFATVDLTLRREAPAQGYALRLSVRNLFDEDVREPSLTGIGGGINIPNDLPLAGRSFFVEFSMDFD